MKYHSSPFSSPPFRGWAANNMQPRPVGLPDGASRGLHSQHKAMMASQRLCWAAMWQMTPRKTRRKKRRTK